MVTELLTDTHRHKDKVAPLPYTIYKVNSKWIIDPHGITKTINLLEEIIGANVLWLGNSVLDMTPKTTTTTTNKLGKSDI